MSTPVLRYETTASHVYEQLKEIPRTGWVIRGVQSPETVYDHTVALLKLADSLHDSLGLSDTEFDDLQHILEIHDWAEAIVGDEYIPNEDREDYHSRKKAKAKRELDGLLELLDGQEYKATVLDLFNRYESGADNVAKLAKQLDKYQALALALEYEEAQGIPLFAKFYEYCKRDWPFSHPVILTGITQLQARHNQLLQQRLVK